MARLNKLFKAFGVVGMLMTMVAVTLTLNLNSYGIPYDLLEFTPTNMLKGNLTLYNENNEPKYNLVIINGGDLIFEVENLWVSALSVDQWAYLEEYEAKNGIRRVVISEDVSANREVELYDPNNWGESLDNQPLIVEESSEIQKIFNDARIKITAPLNVNGIYHTRVKIVDTAITTPFLYYSDHGKKGPVAATITKYSNGREKMSFFFGLGSWSQTSIIINHLWLTWGTRSLFNGFRRVYFTPHIDDVFLGTELINSKTDEVYRTTPSDYEKIAKFQKEVLKIMPEGSFYRVELAFNGNGILIYADYNEALKVDAERYVDLEYVMEPGTGDKRWPMENYQFTPSNIAAFKKDILFNYFNHNVTAQQEFFWSSHTFTHENLDNVCKSDVDNEIRLNIEMAEKLGLTDKEYWSGGSIITPQISGLHNKDALETFRKYGIQSATGDLSRTAICNLENPYLPFYTTLESSNLEGFPVIPRTPTEIYYFCSTKEEDTWMYNQLYNSYYGRDSTFAELLERESERTLLLMTKLRHEAHQFHQANLRYYPKEGEFGESLLEDWTRSVVKLYTKYVDWPLISVKMDKQAETFIERAKLEACGHETKFMVENNKITGISVSASKGDCTVPVTVPGGVKKSSLPSDATLEQIGKDPLTVWIPLKKGEIKSFKLEPEFDWKVDTSSLVEPSTAVTIPVETTTTTTTTTTVTTIPDQTTTTVTTLPVTTVPVQTTTTKKTSTKKTKTKKTKTTKNTTSKKTKTKKTTTKKQKLPLPLLRPRPLLLPLKICGGNGILARDTCCTKGYVCTYILLGYSQCLPEILFPQQLTTTTTTRKTTTTKTKKTTTTTIQAKPTVNQRCSGGYQNCGDFIFGPTCCENGYNCRRVLLNYLCLPF
ncbi:hypothetical protein PIROE2DRAFT_7054 [Piromyces sp. E2]|nr:hypothetical protein PIROE2DRAFT_7054 [Piromyces sp. E2]|eukprot:OUM65893.1 hypothetical protein PIROE2DRAFT_7054 [Piromyces sp. E2]